MGRQTLCRQPHAAGFQRAAPECGKGFHGRQCDQQRQHRGGNADLPAIDQCADGEQGGGQGQAAGNAVNCAGGCVQAVQTPVGARQAAIRLLKRRTLGGQTSGHDQLCLAGDQIDGLRPQAFREQCAAQGGPAGAEEQPDADGRADRQHPHSQGDAEPGRYKAERRRSERRCAQRRTGRRQQAKIEGFQRVEVAGQPKERPRRTAQQFPNLRGARPAPENTLAQCRQCGQRRVVRHESFAVTRSGAPQRQQADAGRWREYVESQGAGGVQSGNGGGGNEPARQSEQPHAGKNGDCRQAGAQRHAAPTPGEQGAEHGAQHRGYLTESARHRMPPPRRVRRRWGLGAPRCDPVVRQAPGHAWRRSGCVPAPDREEIA